MENIHIILAVIFGGAFVLVLVLSLYFNVFDKEGDEKSKSGSGFWKFILCIIIVLAGFMLLGMCGGDNAPWKPRHTYMQKPKQNNVNSIIFFT